MVSGSFFQTYQERIPRIWRKPSAKLPVNDKSQKSSAEWAMVRSPIGQLIPISAKPSGSSPFALSWSHYVLLRSIKDAHERGFFEIEAASESWSIPELERQAASCLHERLALSRNKKAVRKLADEDRMDAIPNGALPALRLLEPDEAAIVRSVTRRRQAFLTGALPALPFGT